jgi:bacterioferritin-associated ferredoxin
MYICICHALSEKDIDAEKARGAKNEEQVFSQLGLRPQCGSCIGVICSRLGAPKENEMHTKESKNEDSTLAVGLCG